jgi:hypothetical protein
MINRELMSLSDRRDTNVRTSDVQQIQKNRGWWDNFTGAVPGWVNRAQLIVNTLRFITINYGK